MTSEYWNKKHTERYSKADWAHKPTIFARQALEYFPDTGKLLDIGTGQGRDADFFQSQGFDVVATDYSSKALESAREHVDHVKFKELDTAEGLPRYKDKISDK